MKFTFGHGIALALGLFVLLMVGFFVAAISQKEEMVVARAWEASMGYDQEMAWARAAQQQGKQPAISVSGGMLRMDFGPSDTLRRGRLYLYRPSDQALDQHLPLAPDSAGLQVLPTQQLRRGRWRVKLTWWAAGDTFAYEEPITLP